MLAHAKRDHGAGRSSRRTLTLTTVLTLSMVAAACGSDDSSSAESTAPASTAATATTVAEATTPASDATGSTAAEATAPETFPASDEPFRVLFVGPLSGPLAVVGTSEAAGFDAAAKVVNAEGGILGHQVEVTKLDDGGDGTKGIALLEEALADDEYHLISAGAGAYDAVAMAAVLADNPTLQIPLAAESVLNDPDTYPNLYIMGGGFGPQTVGVMEKLKADGITKVAILYGDNVPDGAKALEDAADEVGLEVTATVGVPAAATDATPQVQQAMASGPEAIAISGFSPALVPILKARTKLELDVPVYLDPFAAAANLGPTTTPEDRAGVHMEVFPFLVKDGADASDEAWQAFAEAIPEFLPEPLISLYAPLVAWDAVMLARAAAVKAGTISGQEVPDALGTIELAADAPGFIGGEKLYVAGDHFWQLAPSDYIWVDAGPSEGGLIVPGG